jgi:hypothetical protein
MARSARRKSRNYDLTVSRSSLLGGLVGAPKRGEKKSPLHEILFSDNDSVLQPLVQDMWHNTFGRLVLYSLGVRRNDTSDDRASRDDRSEKKTTRRASPRTTTRRTTTKRRTSR